MQLLTCRFPSTNKFSLSEVPLRVGGVALSSVYRPAVVSCPTNKWSTDHIAEHVKALSLFSDPYPTTTMSYTKSWQMALKPEVVTHQLERLTGPVTVSSGSMLEFQNSRIIDDEDERNR